MKGARRKDNIVSAVLFKLVKGFELCHEVHRLWKLVIWVAIKLCKVVQLIRNLFKFSIFTQHFDLGTFGVRRRNCVRQHKHGSQPLTRDDKDSVTANPNI